MAKKSSRKASPELPEVPPPNPQSRWVRLAFTIAPLFVYLLAERITLPGIDGQSFEHVDTSPALYSIVALGIMPWISAAVLVEIVAVVVPRWQHLRHGGMIGRAKLQRATNFLGLVLAAFQAYGVSKQLASATSIYDSGSVGHYYPSRASLVLVLMVTLVAGTILVKLLAEFVSRRGLTNGYGMFATGIILLSTIRKIVYARQILGSTDMIALGAKVIACSVLTWFVFTKFRTGQRVIEADKTSPDDAEDGAEDNPYAAPNEQRSLDRTNAAHAETIVKELPAPASGIIPQTLVMSFLVTMTMFHDSIPGIGALNEALRSGKTSALISLSLLFACTWICTRLFNQPRRVAKVFARIPKSNASEGQIVGEVQEASRHAFVHASLFLFGLMLIDAATRKATNLLVSSENVAFAVVIALDVIKEFRLLGLRRDLVSVWPEHRPYALEAARRALAAESIAMYVRDEHQRRLFQFTAPYIPMEILVPHADARRAMKIVRRVLLEKPIETEKQIDISPIAARRRSLQTWAVALIALFSAGKIGLEWPLAKSKGSRTTKLEFALLDDNSSIMDEATDPRLRAQYNVRLSHEQVPFGHANMVVHGYAYVEKTNREMLDVALQQLETWVKFIVVPEGDRVALGELQRYNEALGKMVASGWRTYLLKGPAILTEADVDEAQAMPDPNNGTWLVRLKFNSEGAKRFEQATAEHIKHRFAILLDGRVQSAPVIQSKITGGVATITMGSGDLEQQRADAQNLEKALNGY